MYGVFCEYFNDCGHYVLKFVTETEGGAKLWADAHESSTTFCKVKELNLGDFDIDDN